MRRTEWHENYTIWKLFWVIETKILIYVFVSIIQTIFKLNNFDVILLVSFSYKKLLQCSFYEDLKNRFKNSKKFVYYNENMYTNSKFQTQLFRKLHRFRACRKNKKCSIFHDLSEYIIFSYDCKLLDWSFKWAPSSSVASKFFSCDSRYKQPKMHYRRWN